MLNGDFGRELTAALAGSDFFAAGAAVHVPATLEFDQITAVPQHNAILKQGQNRFHKGSSGFNFESSGVAGRDSQASAMAEIKASRIPSASRQPIRSFRKRIATGMLTTG